MTPIPDHVHLERTIAALDARLDFFAEVFYVTLIQRRPDLRHLFPDSMTGQHAKFVGAIKALARNFGEPDQLRSALSAWGRAHAHLGLTIADYHDVGTALMLTFREFMAEDWGRDVQAAWQRAYQFAAGLMIAAAAVATPDRPRHAMHI